MPFNDKQKEILIDADNFDFMITDVKPYSNIHGVKKEILLVDVLAVPKMLKLPKEDISEDLDVSEFKMNH